MTRLLACFLTALLLLQVFGREVLVLHFAVNQAALTQKYCVNKARPRLRCNGKCYLARQLRRAESGPAKAPTGALAKAKFEVLAPPHFCFAPPVWGGRVAARRYPRLGPRPQVAAFWPGVFRPPVPRD